MYIYIYVGGGIGGEGARGRRGRGGGGGGLRRKINNEMRRRVEGKEGG